MTLLTIGMITNLTEFHFGHRKRLLVLGGYGIRGAGFNRSFLWIGGELLLRLLIFNIFIPARLLTYFAANDSTAQAMFNYGIQILSSVLSPL